MAAKRRLMGAKAGNRPTSPSTKHSESLGLEVEMRGY